MNRDFIAHRYRILGTIGGGEPPRVFKVEDQAFGVIRALKTAGSDAAERDLIREFGHLNRIRHPNIVSAYDFGRPNLGDPFFIMEYITGAPLVALRADTRGGFGRLMEVSLQVFEALAHIHSHGLVHRELKPGNIILERILRQGRDPEYLARILDFAFACPTGSPTLVDGEARISGTPDYQSPEELRGESVDARADLFSVGVILYEAVTGTQPYRRDSLLGIMTAHEGRPPAPPRRINRAVPRTFSDAIECLVDPDPEGRPDSAEEVVHRIGHGIRGNKFRPRNPLRVRRPPLVDREAGMEVLGELLEKAHQGHPGAVVLRGPPGTGKSSLVEKIRRESQLAGASCWVSDSLRWGSTPYGPVAEILRRGLLERQGDWILASARRWLRRLIPELSQRTRRAGEERRLNPHAEEVYRIALLDALTDLARGRHPETARFEPLVVVIENLEVADEDTRDFVQRFLQMVRGHSTRSENPTPLILVGTEAAESGLTFPRIIPFDALPPKASQEMLTQVLEGSPAPDGLTQPLLDRSEGIPGSLLHRIHELGEQGILELEQNRLTLSGPVPEGDLEEVFRRRAVPFSTLERSVLGIAAVIGTDFKLDQLLQVGRFAATEVCAVLANLVRAEILAPRFNGGDLLFAFPHPGLRTAVYEAIPPNDRINLHRFVARFLERQLRSEGLDLSGSLAEHYLASQNPRKALHYSMEAGRRAEETFSHADAVGHFRQALELLDELDQPSEASEVLVVLAEGLTQLGNLEEARQVARKALQRVSQIQEEAEWLPRIYQALGRIEAQSENREDSLGFYRKALSLAGDRWDPRARSLVLSELANLLTDLGEIQEALQLSEEALDSIRGLHDSAWESSRAYLAFSRASMEGGRTEDAAAGYRMALAMLERGDDPLGTTRALIALGQLNAYQGNLEEARERYLAALESSRQSGDLQGQTETMLLLGGLEGVSGNADQEEVYYQSGLALAERTGMVRALFQAHMGLGIHLRRTGQTKQAAHHMKLAEELAREHDLREDRAKLLLSQGFLLKQMGRHDEALERLEESLTILAEERNESGIAACHAHIANIHKTRRQWEEARRHLALAGEIYSSRDDRLPLAGNLRLLGEIHLEQDEIQPAAELAEKCLELAIAVDNPREIGLARLLSGRILQAQDQMAPARTAMAEAIQSLERAGDAYGSSKARLSLASALCQAGDPVRAQSLAEKAAHGFEEQDAQPELAAAKQLLAEIQASPEDGEAVKAGVDQERLQILSDLIGSIRDQDDLAAGILAAFLGLSRGERALLLTRTDEDQWRLAGSIRIEPEMISDVIRLAESLREPGATMIVPDRPAEDPRIRELEALSGVTALLCIPLLAAGEVVGALYLDSPEGKLNQRAWVLEELRLLGLLAGEILAQAERFAVMARDLQHRAETDPELLPDDLLGPSAKARRVVTTAIATAGSTHPVLLVGEAGVGKRFLAAGIHRAGSRAGAPHLTLSCRALPEGILEIELFGGQKTSVGALDRGRSFLERAQGGTLILTEVDALPKSLQARLVRALRDRQVERMDGSVGMTADIRVLSTASRPLRKADWFDQNLLDYLEQIRIEIPPLRMRGPDIPILAGRLLARAADLQGREEDGLSREALQILKDHPWPGNLDELKAVLERALLRAEGEQIRPEDLSEEIRAGAQAASQIPPDPVPVPVSQPESAPPAEAEETNPEASLAEMEKEHIQRVILHVGGKKVAACRILDISRPTLDRKIKVYGIEVPRNRRRKGS